MGDREYSWKEAQGMLMDMDARGAHDEFFKRYFWYWRDHPEYPPAYLALLDEVIPGICKDGIYDLGALNSLDAEAKKRGGRVLFTVEDASIEFFNFYHDVLLVPLNRDIKRNADGVTLSNYFELEELSRIPDIRHSGREKVNQGERNIGTEVSQWLGKITPEKICDDIVTALNRYDEAITQINSGSSFVGQFEYVKLLANPLQQSVVQDILLMPRRSHGVVEEGYEGVFYPTFVVGKLSARSDD
jgi:hypothetical protein